MAGLTSTPSAAGWRKVAGASLSRRAALLVAAALAAASAGCGTLPPTPTSPSPSASVSIMGASRLGAPQLVTCPFLGRQPQPAGVFRATVPVEELAQICRGRGRGRDRRHRLHAGRRRDRMVPVRGVGSVLVEQLRGNRRHRHQSRASCIPGRARPACVLRYSTCAPTLTPAPTPAPYPAAQPVRRPPVRSRGSEGQGLDVEPDGQRQLGDRLHLREQHSHALQRGAHLQRSPVKRDTPRCAGRSARGQVPPV